MTTRKDGLLLVANYPSDTAYAWWLMEHFWLQLAAHQLDREVFLAFPKINTVSEGLQSARIRLVELKFSSQALSDFFDVCKFIRSQRISAVYLTDQPYFHWRYVILKVLGVKRIVIHDHTPGDRPPINGIKGLIKSLRNRLPLFSANYIFAVSEHMRQRNLTNGRLPAHRCITVQNGIHPVVCVPGARNELRAELKIGNDTILVVTSGRAHPYKRFDFIIETAHRVKTQAASLDIRFVLVGDGPAMSELTEKIIKLGLENVVILLGHRSDVRRILCAADIAMHAALGEGFSLAIIEYMSAGLPVLVPNIPSVSQAVVDNETGMIYPADRADIAAEYIIRLSADNSQRLSMSVASKKRADELYTLERCAHAFNAAAFKAFS